MAKRWRSAWRRLAPAGGIVVAEQANSTDAERLTIVATSYNYFYPHPSTWETGPVEMIMFDEPGSREC